MADVYYNPGVQILTCAVAELGLWWSQSRFSAPYWRLYWNPQRGAHVSWADHTVELRPEHLVLIPPETPYTARSPKRTHLYVHFIAQSPFDRVKPGLHTIRASGAILQTARRLQDGGIGIRAGQWDSLAALALVHAALCHVPDDAFRPAESDPRIGLVLAAMDANLQRPLSNAELAALTGLSTTAFVRLFHQTTGLAPQKLYTRKRIDQTCMRLHFTALGLEQIAREAGFCDRYHFSRAFRRLRGIGPGAFRRQMGRA